MEAKLNSSTSQVEKLLDANISLQRQLEIWQTSEISKSAPSSAIKEVGVCNCVSAHDLFYLLCNIMAISRAYYRNTEWMT